MSRNYDNWGRLVEVVLRREQLREMARQNSRNSSYLSDSDSSYSGFDSPLRSLSSSSELDAMDASPIHTGEMTSSSPGVVFFLSAGSRNITISCGDSSEHTGWVFSSDSSSFLGNVAKIDSVEWFVIRGKMKTQMMTPKAIYGAYLVYKLKGQFKGPAKAIIRYVDDETDGYTGSSANVVHLQQGNNREGETVPVRGEDGWMEVRLGEFYVGDKDDREVEVRLTKTTHVTMGLIIDGIEFRPDGYTNTEINRGCQDPEPVIIAREVGSAATKNDQSTENVEINISLLQQFVPPSSALRPEPVGPYVHNLLLRKAEVDELGSHANLSPDSHHTPRSNADIFCPDWNLMNNSSLQHRGVGNEMTSKLLLPKDDCSLESLTQDEIFSGGYGCLSRAAYFFHGAEKLIKQKEREIDDLKYKLLACEINAQLVIGAKDSEVEELRNTVEALKIDAEKCKEKSKEEERKADQRIHEAEWKLVNAEAQAAAAIESYRNSEELKVEKHKFASKAFSIGFELCKRQVLEIDPNFDIHRIDIIRIEAAANSSDLSKV